MTLVNIVYLFNRKTFTKILIMILAKNFVNAMLCWFNSSWKDYIYRHICHFSSVEIALFKCKFWFGVTPMAMAHICHRCHSWCTIYRRRTKNVNSRLFLYFFARTGALNPKWWTISYATMWHIFQRFNHKRLLNKNFYGTSLTTKLQPNCFNTFLPVNCYELFRVKDELR